MFSRNFATILRACFVKITVGRLLLALQAKHITLGPDILIKQRHQNNVNWANISDFVTNFGNNLLG